MASERDFYIFFAGWIAGQLTLAAANWLMS